MPIYEFVCEKCNKVFSQLCDIDIDTVNCECGEATKKILSATNGVFNTACSNPLNPAQEVHTDTLIHNMNSSRLLGEFVCPACGNIDERFIYDADVESQQCNKCNSLMKKCVDTTRFELKYDPKKDICDGSR